MLTPSFNLSQTDDILTVVIKAPFAKIDEADILVEDNEFRFFSKPYYLRLTLPGNLIEDGHENATYDVEKGSFIIHIPKAKKGEFFEGLSMLTKLLAPSGSTNIKSHLIEVIDSSEDVNETDDDLISDEDFDWHIEQEVIDDELNIEGPLYGFANQRCAEFKKLCAEFSDVLDLQQPDSTPNLERRQLREVDEDTKFNDDYYLADLYENESINDILSFKSNWNQDFINSNNSKISLKFSDHENEKMRNLPRKEHLLDKKMIRIVYLSLIDILYAYVYNHRTSLGDNTVESAWTICRLSGTLSWMDNYTCIKDVCRSNMRRSLSYPLYRHWKLSKKVWKDTCELLSLGKDWILRCFLEIHDIFMKSESYYILNNLYIADYCIWIQSIGNKHLETLNKEMINISIKKGDMDFDLLELEMGAKLALEESDLIQTVNNFDGLTLENTNEDITSLEKKFDNIDISQIGKEICEKSNENLDVNDLVHSEEEDKNSSSSSSYDSSSECTSEDDSSESDELTEKDK